jgi:predicted XRE-type DNA-binding protein
MSKNAKSAAGEALEAALAKTAAFHRRIEALPGYRDGAEEFDREYEVAKVLEEARRRSRLTQAQVAERMGTTQSAVARMAKSNITLDALARYLKACGATLKISACF